MADPKHKILWVDDDDHILDSAARLFRQQPWTLVAVSSAQEARDRIQKETFAVVVADQRLQAASGVDVLAFAKTKSPSSTRILLTGRVETSVLEEAVNRGHVFRFIAKPWDNEQLLVDIAKAIEHHQLKMTEAGLLKEVSLQNRQLERLTSGLEQLVTERTLTAEGSKVEAEKQLAHVRELVRFIKDLSNLTSVDELMGLIRKELKAFHEVRPPVLGYVVAERRPMILFFQGKQIVEREARTMWSNRSRIRFNEREDRLYLANEFGRPFIKLLAVPLKRRAVASDHEAESPATLFFEHSLADDAVERFLAFISERLQPLSIALDRILLEYHLKYTALQWESTFDGIKDPIAIIDIDYEVVRANRHFSGGSTGRERTFEKNCHRVLAGAESICRGCPVAAALETGLPQKGMIKRGSHIFEVSTYPIRLQGDAISTNVINHYVDVTDARELHGRMVQSEKMAAIGLLAGNIAHELNNPLTGIRSLAQVLLSELPEGQLHDDIREVENAAGRSQKIIENLLDFSKGGTEEKQVRMSLNEIVRRTLPMLKTAMREHRSELHLSEEEGEVRVEPHLMQQVVFNLVNNACQAMKDAGTITIETSMTPERGTAGVQGANAGEVQDRRWCELHIIDTGVGIPPEIIESIFEPFFTTKEKGQGTGLGLSMSQSVIQKFGGEIAVKSVIGEGTHFTVRLPVVGGTPAAVSTKDAGGKEAS
jgi:two-component system NtrC family sensor kinase